MSNEDKAKELFEKFGEAGRRDTGSSAAAKACALICVDEILSSLAGNLFNYSNQQREFWQQVKQSIQKL